MRSFFDAIARERAKGRLLAAWTVGGEGAGSGALFAREGDGYALRYRGDAFPAALADAVRDSASKRGGMLSHGGTQLFLEPLAGPRRLVICGAGHVALGVIRLGVMLGFEVTAIEDRPEYAEKARASGAGRAICRPFGEALDEIEGDAMTAFVVMTREHAHDVDCLRRILAKPCAYAGMMGSHARTAKLRQQLLEEGFDAGRVEGLHMPIGLAIGARTPEEIALSVMAEIVSVLNASDAGEGFPPGMLEALTDPGFPGGVLAMIVEKNGEAPRRPGAKLLLMPDGRFLGTVGGGYAEAVILKTAGKMLRDGCRESRLTHIDTGKGAMRCGGEIGVFLLPLAPPH